MYTPPPEEGEVRLFMDRIRNGINRALNLPGPSLVVAHGGVHWALCCLMAIEGYAWTIPNCAIVHFFVSDDGKWAAKRLS